MTERSPPLDGSPSRRPLLGRQCRMGARRRGCWIPPWLPYSATAGSSTGPSSCVSRATSMVCERARVQQTVGRTRSWRAPTAARVAAALGAIRIPTIDDLLAARSRSAIGWRASPDGRLASTGCSRCSMIRTSACASSFRISRPAGAPTPGRGARRRRAHRGRAGLVQVIHPTGRPVLRQGEAAGGVGRRGVCRNIGEEVALVFRVLRDDAGRLASPPAGRFGHARGSTRASERWSTLGIGAREPTQRRRCSVGECGMPGGWPRHWYVAAPATRARCRSTANRACRPGASDSSERGFTFGPQRRAPTALLQSR